MPRMLRPVLMAFSLAAFSIALAAPLSALAQAAGTATQTHEASVQTPAGKFIQDLGARPIPIIANKAMPQAQRDTEFSKILSDSFDLKTIGRFVIGRTWNGATPDQQSEYMNLFKALVIKNYGERMTL